jgi:hypothetical protein
MSRRKHLAVRSPCGRISRSANPELMSPAEVHRLVSAAQAGLRDPVWSSEIGRLHLQGKITSSQFAAAKRWSALVAAYSDACCSPRPPQTMSLDAAGGTSADPDSATGIREARRHERSVESYLEGRTALRLAGSAAERVVDSVCVQDRAPAGLHELDALRTGLQSLSTWWSARRKAGPR